MSSQKQKPSTRPKQSKYVILSGYALPTDDFRLFISSIPALKAAVSSFPLDEPMTFEFFISMYAVWKTDDQPRAPRVKYLFEGDVAEDSDDFLGEETSSHITSCLFPVRYTPCIEDEELLEGAPYSTETQKDKDALARIVKLVEESGGKLDTTKMTFRWVHALHPSRATNY